MATPAVDGNTLFVRTIKHLVAISTPTSEVKDL
jgi:hypothetical protein